MGGRSNAGTCISDNDNMIIDAEFVLFAGPVARDSFIDSGICQDRTVCSQS